MRIYILFIILSLLWNPIFSESMEKKNKKKTKYLQNVIKIKIAGKYLNEGKLEITKSGKSVVTGLKELDELNKRHNTVSIYKAHIE